MRVGLVAVAALIGFSFSFPLAAAELIVNGGFETISVNRSSVFGTDTHPWTGSLQHTPSDGMVQVVNGWQTAGFNLLMRPGEADTVGAATQFDCGGTPCPFKLWGPGNGSANGLTESPLGGNYIAADGAYQNAPIYQVLNDLEVGRTYTVTFWWAAAQQFGPLFNGDTTEGWKICFGECAFTFGAEDGYANFTSGAVQDTGAVANANHGFVPWQFESMNFVATDTTQKLSLLAYGTPLSQPPFALIDGVSILGPDAVPEPSSWAMMLFGFGLIGGIMRSRKRGRNWHRPLSAQIV